MNIITPSNTASVNTIITQTKKGQDIANSQYFVNLSPWDLRQINLYKQKYFAEFRSSPTSIYNCHGMVFASRRTGIDNIQEIHKILNDDEYSEILPTEVLPGDIILYFSETGDMEHSGIVISKPEPPLYIPDVFSKWGNAGEVIHPANRCPYLFIVKYYKIAK